MVSFEKKNEEKLHGKGSNRDRCIYLGIAKK